MGPVTIKNVGLIFVSPLVSSNEAGAQHRVI